MDGDADLILHRAEPEPQVDWLPLGSVALVPVAAPGFPGASDPADIGPEDMRSHTQAVIRDTRRRPSGEAHFLLEGAHQCSVPDHQTKREVILRGLAWGHLPDYLIGSDLEAGRLIPLSGLLLPGRTETLAAGRLRNGAAGPVLARLWAWLEAGSG